MAEGAVVTDSFTKENERRSLAKLTVRTTVIRDGTPGISLSLDGEVIGEWTDSRAKLLSLTDDYRARVHGADGEQLYLLSAPGRAVSGEETGDKEITIIFEL